MLMLIPRLNPFQEDLLDRVFSPAPPPPPPPPPGTPDGSGLWFRLSGAPGSFAMIGLGDIVRVSSLIATVNAMIGLGDIARMRPSSPPFHIRCFHDCFWVLL